MQNKVENGTTQNSPHSVNEDAKFSADVLAAIRANRKIKAIKLLREERDLDLKDAKHLVDNYIARNPPDSPDRSGQGKFRFAPLVLAIMVTAALYAAYKALA